MRNELPAAIQHLLGHIAYRCSEDAHVHARQDLLRKQVGAVANAHDNGWELIRNGALVQLADEDLRQVERALACLFVVGNAADVPAVEAVLARPEESLQKSGRTCLFEIRRRASSRV
jgi:hypothetical protein